jgi:hypothetical protein
MTKLPAFRLPTDFAALAAEWDRANAASRSGTPKPSPVDTAAATAAMIVNAGRWRRGEMAAPEYVPQNEKRQRRQDEGDEEPEPGSLIVDAIKRQREEGSK